MWFKTMSKVHCPFVASQHSLDSKCESKLEFWDLVIKGREEQGNIILEQILWCLLLAIISTF